MATLKELTAIRLNDNYWQEVWTGILIKANQVRASPGDYSPTALTWANKVKAGTLTATRDAIMERILNHWLIQQDGMNVSDTDFRTVLDSLIEDFAALEI